MTLTLGGGKVWRLSVIGIDPAATSGDPSNDDLRDFSVLVSMADSPTSGFHTVLDGTTMQKGGVQFFKLPKGTVARYVQILLKNNYGGDRIALAEFEVYGLPPKTALTRHIIQRAPVKASKQLAKVRYIYHGLTLSPPHANTKGAHVPDSLFAGYGMHTAKQQKASVRFNDGTFLHIAQLTDAALKTAHVTTVNKGTVEELVQPGTNHKVQTAAAIASAIGTRFLVIVKGHKKHLTVRFVVIEGSVLVKNKYGSVVVKTGQATTVHIGHKPGPARHVKVGPLHRWDKGLPSPKLAKNVALDANGGQVILG